MALGRLVVAFAVVLGMTSCGDGTPRSGAVSVVAGEAATTAGGSPSAAASTSTTTGRSHPGTVCRSGDGGSPYLDSTQERPRLAADVVPVVVVACSIETEQVPGDGEWSVLVDRRATAGLTPVVTAIRRDDDRAPQSICTAELDLDPQVWFVDAAGHAVLPRWPRDSCGHLRRDGVAALAALTWTTTVRVRLARLVPQAAIDAGCEAAFKYLVQTVADQGGAAKPGGFADLAHPVDPRLCRYRHTPADQGSGDFESGHRLSATAWTALRHALDASAPVRPCTRSATRFVLLYAGPFVEIELDGCHRVLTPDDGLRQATPSLLALLT